MANSAHLFRLILSDRLRQLNLEKLPPCVLDYIETDIAGAVTQMVARRVTPAYIARIVPRALRPAKKAAVSTPDSAAPEPAKPV